MKAINLQSSRIGISLALAICFAGVKVSAQEALMPTTAQVEDLVRKGDRVAIRVIAEKLNSDWEHEPEKSLDGLMRLCSALFSTPHSLENYQFFQSICDLIISKPVEKPSDFDLKLISAYSQISKMLSGEQTLGLFKGLAPEVLPIVRSTNSRLLAVLVSKMSDRLIKDFQQLPVSKNVTPEVGSGPSFSGMSPDAISDPKEKAAYMAAMKNNYTNLVANKVQKFITEFLLNDVDKIEEYFIQSYRLVPRNTEELRDFLYFSKLQGERQAKIIKIVTGAAQPE